MLSANRELVRECAFQPDIYVGTFFDMIHHIALMALVRQRIVIKGRAELSGFRFVDPGVALRAARPGR
jgi:hypothetical protein